MHTFTIWILLCGVTPAARSVIVGEFCNFNLNLARVGSCNIVFGPNVNCSESVVEHLRTIKKAQVSYYTKSRLLDPSTRYADYKILKEEYRALIRLIEDFYWFLQGIHNRSQSTSDKKCVSLNDLERHIAYLKTKDNSAGLEYWIDIYYPVIAGIELIFGILGNVMVVMVFVRNEDIRTGPNKVILNLAIGDMLLLITNIVVFYGRYRWLPTALTYTTCYIMSYSRTAGIASSVYSMVVLSILRFLATVSTPDSKTLHFMKKYLKIPVLLPLVWTLAGLTGIFDAFGANTNCEFPKGTLKQYFRFACICLLPFVVMGGFSIATSRILRQSAQQLPGEQTPGVLHEKRARERGARVLLCLVIVFCITYLPLNIYFLVGKEYGPNDHLYIFTNQLLIPLSSCLNPVALCVGSYKYRMHFKKYIFKVFCCKCCQCCQSEVELEC